MQHPDGPPRPKRFWKAAAVGLQTDAGWPVQLDGRAAKTPTGAPLALPTQALAAAIAEEWDGVGEHLEFARMPLNRLAFTAIDRIAQAREAVAQEVGRYAAADVICYFAASPQGLVERQEAEWAPMLAWAKTALKLDLVRASGITHQAQPPKTAERVEKLALELDDFALAGLAWAAALYGSAVLAFALERRELSGEAAFDRSRLDEAFQVEQWGVDADAAQRTEGLREESRRLDDWFSALNHP
jgi:chaperone required for assembly of F1-ATPase